MGSGRAGVAMGCWREASVGLPAVPLSLDRGWLGLGVQMRWGCGISARLVNAVRRSRAQVQRSASRR